MSRMNELAIATAVTIPLLAGCSAAESSGEGRELRIDEASQEERARYDTAQAIGIEAIETCLTMGCDYDAINNTLSGISYPDRVGGDYYHLYISDVDQETEGFYRLTPDTTVAVSTSFETTGTDEEPTFVRPVEARLMTDGTMSAVSCESIETQAVSSDITDSEWTKYTTYDNSYFVPVEEGEDQFSVYLETISPVEAAQITDTTHSMANTLISEISAGTSVAQVVSELDCRTISSL
ncbi:hypothetical protein KA047_02715 [Candidatus Saccharibacteria bacterium]|nr:hypothetical protein [Candidatus Saccharibacteria bacterium]